jgi:uncharacterized protein (TIGR01244 family)
MSVRHLLTTAILGFALSTATLTAGQSVTKENLPGVANFARVETTVACAGAIKTESIPEIKKLGFVSIINLRLADEPGANVEAEGAAAKAAGMKYFHIPLNGQEPDPAVADKFLAAITTKGNEPAFIHCAGGNRAAAMWFIKRLVVDRWSADRASSEAADLGMTSAKLKQFGLDYAAAHKR